MRKMRFLVMIFLGLFILTAVVKAQDLQMLTDDFYMGLAEVIENNMTDAEGCLNDVNNYYEENSFLVEQIKEEAKKTLNETLPLMEEYTEETVASNESDLSSVEIEEIQWNEQSASPAMQRYAEALEAFTQKYPKYSFDIGIKAMELFPDIEPVD
ncbi:MAG: hypothetical protein ABH836_02230 [Candidatus Omnitrophota bacterium]